MKKPSISFTLLYSFFTQKTSIHFHSHAIDVHEIDLFSSHKPQRRRIEGFVKSDTQFLGYPSIRNVETKMSNLIARWFGKKLMID
jgi:hypothetical protein